MSEDLWRRGAGELAELIANREVSSRDVVDAHLERIEAVNDHLNAITLVLADEARAAADRADASTPEGALHGVPVTVKENVDVAGTPTTSGIPALAAAVSPLDAPVVERLRAAGAIPIARMNLPDLGLRIHTDSSLRGLTRNPWDPEITAGGSSGGEGSALASGMSPLGLGNDVGGSLRNPAHCCGIASIKPTVGRVPHATVIPPEDLGPAMQMMAVRGRDGPARERRAAGGCGSWPGCIRATRNPSPSRSTGRGRSRVAWRCWPSRPAATPIPRSPRPCGARVTRSPTRATRSSRRSRRSTRRRSRSGGRLLFIDIRAQEPVLRQVMGPDAVRSLGLRAQVIDPVREVART